MAMGDRRWRLVCYDIRDPVRYRKVYKIVTGHGRRLQYSIFRCRLDDAEVERLRWRLAEVMDPSDSLLILDLCSGCAARVVAKNQVDDWKPEPRPFRLLGEPGDQAPDPVEPNDR